MTPGRHRQVAVDVELWSLVDRARGPAKFGVRPSWIGTLRELVVAGLAAREGAPSPLAPAPPPVNPADEKVIDDFMTAQAKETPVRKLTPKRKAEPGRAYTECLATLDEACADPARFIVGDLSTLTKAQVMQLHRLAKKYEPEVWARVGRYIAAVHGVHDHGRRLLTPRWVIRAFEESVQESLMWEQRGAGLSERARKAVVAAASRAGGKLVSWEDRTLSPDEVAAIEVLARDFAADEWARLGEWVARGGLSWVREPVVGARLFAMKGREWFQRALAAHRPQVASPGVQPVNGATLLDLMQTRDGGEIRRIVDHRR